MGRFVPDQQMGLALSGIQHLFAVRCLGEISVIGLDRVGLHWVGMSVDGIRDFLIILI